MSGIAPAKGLAAPVTIADNTNLPNDDNGNGNLLVAQNTTLLQTATIQSLYFYVTVAGGNLRLRIYDATGTGGGPGASEDPLIDSSRRMEHEKRQKARVTPPRSRKMLPLRGLLLLRRVQPPCRQSAYP